ITPIDHGAQGLLSRWSVTAPTYQESKAIVESHDDLVGAEHADSGGGQFDRQRQSVEAATDLSHRRRVGLNQVNVRSDTPCSLDEELPGFGSRDIGDGFRRAKHGE